MLMAFSKHRLSSELRAASEAAALAQRRFAAPQLQGFWGPCEPATGGSLEDHVIDVGLSRGRI